MLAFAVSLFLCFQGVKCCYGAAVLVLGFEGGGVLHGVAVDLVGLSVGYVGIHHQAAEGVVEDFCLMFQGCDVVGFGLIFALIIKGFMQGGDEVADDFACFGDGVFKGVLPVNMLENSGGLAF